MSDDASRNQDKRTPQQTALRLVFAALFAAMLAMPLILTAPVPIAWADNATNAPASSPAPRRTSLTNPLGSGVTIEVLAGRAVRGFIGLSGSVALVMFVYGAFLWITAGGNLDKIKKGKQVFTWAVIGLAIIFGAYAFLKTFINTLGG